MRRQYNNIKKCHSDCLQTNGVRLLMTNVLYLYIYEVRGLPSRAHTRPLVYITRVSLLRKRCRRERRETILGERVRNARLFKQARACV